MTSKKNTGVTLKTLKADLDKLSMKATKAGFNFISAIGKPVEGRADYTVIGGILGENSAEVILEYCHMAECMTEAFARSAKPGKRWKAFKTILKVVKKVGKDCKDGFDD